MKQNYFTSLIALAIVAFSGCSTPGKAPLPADASPQAEIHRASASIEEASRKQYDRLAPDHFQRAVEYRNSAKEKLSKGEDNSQVLNDVAISLQAASEAQSIGEANSGSMRSVLAARQFAIAAQAPKFEEKKFRSADKDLSGIGEKLEAGSYKLDAEELADIEKRFGQSEVAARKRAELTVASDRIEMARKDGAKRKTPVALENALVKQAGAEQAIEMSPHNPEGYAVALREANLSAQKLSEVLAIARSNGATEDAALTIWIQSQALERSRAEFAQAKVESDKKLMETKEQAAADQTQLEGVIAARDASMDQQHESIAVLKTENSDYAKTEELKQKIEEIKQTFAPDEAEVMKDGKNLVVRLKKMQFSTGRSDLNPDSFATLRKVDTLIAAVPATQVTVEGHTDSIGTDKLNKNLSQQRAESVKKYLLSQRLSETLNIGAAGYGSDRPLTTNKTKDGRATNRRVDIVIETPTVL